MTVGGRVGALWIGGLEPYMDEEFLMSAMRQSGEENIISIKVKCDSSRIVYYVCVYVVLFFNDSAVVGMSQMSSIFCSKCSK